MSEMMDCLLVRAGHRPEKISMENTLEELQKKVGGYIEVVYPFAEPVGLVCNDEGKMLGLPLNRALRDEETGEAYDVLAGDFLVVGLSEDDFCSLTPEQMKEFGDKFDTPECFMKVNGRIMALPLPEAMIREEKAQQKETRVLAGMCL